MRRDKVITAGSKISADSQRMIPNMVRSTTAGTAYTASLPRRNWKSTQRMDAARLLRRVQFCLSPAVKQRSFSSKHTDKQYKAPFVVYADFEALTRPVSKAGHAPKLQLRAGSCHRARSRWAPCSSEGPSLNVSFRLTGSLEP